MARPGPPDPADAQAAEARRQQLLLQVLWRQQPPEALQGACAGPAERVARGLQAYRDNAAAMADRVLAGACSVLAGALGPQAAAVLARQAWRRAPPHAGDLDDWTGLGDLLPVLIAEAPPLVDQPWLADLARLEWAVHQAERAADAPEGPPEGLDGLAAPDAPLRRLQLRPGTTLLALQWPVAALWQRARAEPDALPGGCGPAAPEAVLVWRQGWRATVQPLAAGDAAFTAAVLAGQALGPALDAAAQADAGWSFEPWLLQALRAGWVTAVQA
ncbi:putative DNA-binding domain-containing protein [Ideonella sp. DXS22W]|uniref:DNA-binding domain-containing protein n=1 Tax=Pseudaquabacterium inlustre TaxID=2984192 RepID=A0ABU9CBS0_9BURK